MSSQTKESQVENEPEGVRLHVRIAHSGLTSRRQAEEMIRQGRVTVNGQIVDQQGFKTFDSDDIRVDGHLIVKQKPVTVVLNKPVGLITTLSDPQGRPTIVKLIPKLGVVLKPVGRLDKDTEGLLILTSDGELAHRLAHPRYGVEKEYEAIVQGLPDESDLDKLRKGIYIEGGKTKPAKVSVIHAEPSTETTSLRITIHEGRNRQVRRMCMAINHPVIRLRRTRLGPLKVKGMAPGECRNVSKVDLDKLREAVGLTDEESGSQLD